MKLQILACFPMLFHCVFKIIPFLIFTRVATLNKDFELTKTVDLFKMFKDDSFIFKIILILISVFPPNLKTLYDIFPNKTIVSLICGDVTPF